MAFLRCKYEEYVLKSIDDDKAKLQKDIALLQATKEGINIFRSFIHKIFPNKDSSLDEELPTRKGR